MLGTRAGGVDGGSARPRIRSEVRTLFLLFVFLQRGFRTVLWCAMLTRSPDWLCGRPGGGPKSCWGHRRAAMGGGRGDERKGLVLVLAPCDVMSPRLIGLCDATSYDVVIERQSQRDMKRAKRGAKVQLTPCRRGKRPQGPAAQSARGKPRSRLPLPPCNFWAANPAALGG